MALITVAAAKERPGATTLATGLAATWPVVPGRPLLLVEADPWGGVLAARYETLRGERTLADAALRTRRRFRMEAVTECSRRLWGWLPVVVAPLAPHRAYDALARRETPTGPTAAERLAAGLAGCADVDVLVDIGRLTPQSPALPFVAHASSTLVVTGLGFEAAATTLALLDDLRATEPGGLVLVGVGAGPYTAMDVGTEANVEWVAELPWDAPAAAALRDGSLNPRRLHRSALWRAIASLAARLAAAAGPPSPPHAAAVGVPGDPDGRRPTGAPPPGGTHAPTVTGPPAAGVAAPHGTSPAGHRHDEVTG